MTFVLNTIVVLRFPLQKYEKQEISNGQPQKTQRPHTTESRDEKCQIDV